MTIFQKFQYRLKRAWLSPHFRDLFERLFDVIKEHEADREPIRLTFNVEENLDGITQMGCGERQVLEYPVPGHNGAALVGFFCENPLNPGINAGSAGGASIEVGGVVYNTPYSDAVNNRHPASVVVFEDHERATIARTPSVTSAPSGKDNFVMQYTDQDFLIGFYNLTGAGLFSAGGG